MIRRAGLRAGSTFCSVKPSLIHRGLSTASPRTIQSLLYSEETLLPLNEGDICCVNGWVRSVRTQKHIAFVALGDGTTLKPLQVVLQPDQADGLSNGAAVSITGQWMKSIGAKQAFELHAQQVQLLGSNDAKVCPFYMAEWLLIVQTYPLQKKSHSPDFLRTIPHLRHRSPYSSLVLRLRSAVIYAVTRYFHDRNWIQTHPPLITSSDCEGAGEVFSVTHNNGHPEQSLEHFFRRPKYLTVSSQLHLEALSQSVGKVWTLSPTFRAEMSDTPRHLSEFYMLEAEMAFVTDLNGVMDVVQGLLAHVGQALLDDAQLREELTLATETAEKKPTFVNATKAMLEKRWAGLAKGRYSRVSYHVAVSLLEDAAKGGHTFDQVPTRSSGLQAEHEKYLAEHYDGPVFVTDYPRSIKPFYMASSNEDGSAACFDLLVPDVCELVGGSLREHDPEKLLKAMADRGLLERESLDGDSEEKVPSNLQWYLDLRRYGSAAHGGFGLGFDRLLCYITGVTSLRDVVAFPRWHGRCEC